MNVEELEIPGVLLISPPVHRDARGWFMESYNEARYRDAGLDMQFVQDNHSRSGQGVLRGLHYQLKHPQGKLVRAGQGSIFDVVVDVRQGSPYFGRWIGVVLDDVDHKQLYIPPGFAHGFYVLSQSADLIYKCTDFYAPGDEYGVLWNDPDLGVTWPVTGEPVVAGKDKCHPRLADAGADLPRYQQFIKPDR